MTEEEILAAIRYVEENNGSGICQDDCTSGCETKNEYFIELAKVLARVLKAKLVKVEDGFGSEVDLKCYRFGTGIVNVIRDGFGSEVDLKCYRFGTGIVNVIRPEGL